MEKGELTLCVAKIINSVTPVISFEDLKEMFINQYEGSTLGEVIASGVPIFTIEGIITERIRIRRRDANRRSVANDINRISDIIKNAVAVKQKRRRLV